jgi:tetratricopeptide (TPR) repeat protein
MKLGARISKVFGLQKVDFSNQEALDAALNEAIAACMEKIKPDATTTPDVFKPVLRLMEHSTEAKVDPLYILGKALEQMGPQQHLKKLLRETLMQIPHISREALPALARYAEQDTYNISLWRRVIDDFTFYEKRKSAARMKMAYIINVAPCFPDGKESNWFDMETEEEAQTLLETVYQELLLQFKPEWTKLDLSLKCAEVLGKFRPEDDHAAFAIALIFAGQKEVLRARLPLVEIAWEIDPNNHLLKRFVGLAWAQFHREDRGQDAFTILQEVFSTDPDDPQVEATLVELAGVLDLKPEERIAFLKGLSDSHPKNTAYKIEFTKALAHHNINDSTVLRHITEAMAYAPMDSELQYLQAMVLLNQQQNAVQAIGILERLHQRDTENRQIARALAECYAGIGRKDERALQLYQEAIASGTQDHGLIRLYVEHELSGEPTEERLIELMPYVMQINPDTKLPQVLDAIREEKSTLQELAGLLAQTRGLEESLLLQHMGKILAENLTRTTVRQVISLPPGQSIIILEAALSIVPDSNLLAMQLVKTRLSLKMEDQRTLDLLAQVCRAEPDELELRLRRAEILEKLGQKKLALSLYQELYERKSNISSRTSSSTGINFDWEQTRESLVERIFHLTLALDKVDQDDLAFIYQYLQAPDASMELLIDLARKPLGRYTHPSQQVVMEKAKIISPDDEIISRNLSCVRLTLGNCSYFEQRWEKIKPEEREKTISELTNRLITLRRLNPDFVLAENAGETLARCMKTYTDHKKDSLQELIGDYCGS